MQTLKLKLRRSPLARYLVLPYRAWVAFSYYRPGLGRIPQWLIQSRETNNWTYELTQESKNYLSCFVAHLTGVPIERAAKYVAELEGDIRLQQHVQKHVEEGPRRYTADAHSRPGRRYLYYALVRATKPRVVVEAGTDKGYGACILASALEQNAREGEPGYLYSLDIAPSAGELFQEPYNRFGKILTANSCESLRTFRETIDFFIHEDWSDLEYEERQFGLLTNKLSPRAIVVTPWPATEVLMHFAQKWGRSYLIFHDQPLNHWFTGTNIGVVFEKRSAAEPDRAVKPSTLGAERQDKAIT
jgi:hypothetical protein